jgi:hypothetical protein
MRETAGARGRLRVESEYSLKQTIMAYEELWSGLLGYSLLTEE